jgi:hypothetical protein
MAVTSASTSAAAAFTYLIPAQIPGAKHVVVKKKKVVSSSESCSAVALRSDDDDEGLVISSLTTATATTENDYCEQQQQPAAPPSSSSSATTTSSSSSSSSIKSSQSTTRRRRYKPRRHQRTGNLPDVHWRSIPMSHLRCHPNFQPLPPPSQITSIPTKEHVRYFRQDSWQWDYLHRGRCTTSQTAAALGFLESKAAHYLGIPNSLRRGGYGAWERLREHVPDELYGDLKALECVLCEGRATDDLNNEGNNSATTSSSSSTTSSDKVSTWRPGAKETERLWISSQQLRQRRSIHNITESSTSSTSHQRRKPFPFVAKYIPNLSYEELYQRKLVIQHYEQSPSPMATRMRWGNAQEATSILTALNYFCKLDEKTIIREVGMCGCAFDHDVKKYNNDNDDNDNDDSDDSGNNHDSGADDLLQGLSIGATPDALVCHGDGTVEVLEVKNHCPFVWNKISPHYTQKNHGGGSSGGNRRNGNNSSSSSSISNRKKKKHKMKGNRHRHQNNRKLNDDIADNYGEGGGDHHKPSAATRKKENGDSNNNNNRLPKHYLIRDFHLEQRIPPVYIPQLMMEILCVGDAIDLDDNDKSNNKQQQQSKPICKSAIMVRQTATKGAILLRLNRDEEWITEMKYWLGKFKREFVDEGIIPEDNFFWDTGGERYQKFLQRTKQLSESVEFVAFIEHGNIQRVVFEHGVKGEIPLFLDNVDKAD